jgi:hypothetical protein
MKSELEFACASITYDDFSRRRRFNSSVFLFGPLSWSAIIWQDDMIKDDPFVGDPDRMRVERPVQNTCETIAATPVKEHILYYPNISKDVKRIETGATGSRAFDDCDCSEVIFVITSIPWDEIAPFGTVNISTRCTCADNQDTIIGHLARKNDIYSM